MIRMILEKTDQDRYETQNNTPIIPVYCKTDQALIIIVDSIR